MKCNECISFADGICRNPQSRRRDVGYFQEACALAEPDINETKDPEKETTMKENNETTTTTQVCKDCGRELPREEFQKGPHGYMNYCKECFRKRQKAGKQGPKPAGIAEVRKALIEKDANVKDTPILDTLPNILIAACRLEDAEIIDLVSDLCDELRERGYEINGNIYRKYEI